MSFELVQLQNNLLKCAPSETLQFEKYAHQVIEFKNSLNKQLYECGYDQYGANQQIQLRQLLIQLPKQLKLINGVQQQQGLDKQNISQSINQNNQILEKQQNRLQELICKISRFITGEQNVLVVLKQGLTRKQCNELAPECQKLTYQYQEQLQLCANAIQSFNLVRQDLQQKYESQSQILLLTQSNMQEQLQTLRKELSHLFSQQQVQYENKIKNQIELNVQTQVLSSLKRTIHADLLEIRKQLMEQHIKDGQRKKSLQVSLHAELKICKREKLYSVQSLTSEKYELEIELQHLCNEAEKAQHNYYLKHRDVKAAEEKLAQTELWLVQENAKTLKEEYTREIIALQNLIVHQTESIKSLEQKINDGVFKMFIQDSVQLTPRSQMMSTQTFVKKQKMLKLRDNQ
ncbi:Hypothetical_protein [Hexamita inflata]|uniref:Hypothetical_protein n=1 Tax=Hexamita inflata TaxID=28002 RepID=A0AA86UDV0_9EUKA|nr:Hypothetical protein HINF_LOCUS41895 [Hexamita inflata]